MKVLIRRYKSAIIVTALFVVFLFLLPVYRQKAIETVTFQIRIILLILPPIFVLLGLLDAWVPRRQMMRFMGPESGIKGGSLAFFLGSFAAGPLYGAFPVAAMLMKKGVSFINILIFIGAWSTTKIPMFLFENAALGSRFALSRLAIDIVGIVLIALALKSLVPEAEQERLYRQVGK